MSLQYNNALVLRADVRSMLFRKCGKCKSKIIGVTQDTPSTMLFYCVHCREHVQEFNASYNLVLLVQINRTLQYFLAHEVALVPLLGCEPKRFCELVQNHPHILDVVRERFDGFLCHLIVRQPGDISSKGSSISSSMKKAKKTQKKSYKHQVLEAIIPADPLCTRPFLHAYLPNTTAGDSRIEQQSPPKS